MATMQKNKVIARFDNPPTIDIVASQRRVELANSRNSAQKAVVNLATAQERAARAIPPTPGVTHPVIAALRDAIADARLAVARADELLARL